MGLSRGSFELLRNPIWLFLAAYASLALRLTKFDFNDAIIRGVLFVPLFTKFLTAMHRDAPLGAENGASKWVLEAWFSMIVCLLIVISKDIYIIFVYFCLISTDLGGIYEPETWDF